MHLMESLAAKDEAQQEVRNLRARFMKIVNQS